MPNVKGLDPAPALLSALPAGHVIQYGPHATVSHDGTTIRLSSVSGEVIASVTFGATKPRIKASLARIDGDTITPVNALLRPYGRVRIYFRTGEYRWHPVDGPASKPVGSRPPTNLAPASPVVTPSVPVVAPSVAPEVTLPVPAVVHPVASTFTVDAIETAKRWQDRGGKRPTARPITKTFSIADDVFVPTESLKRFDAMLKRRVAGQPAFGIITGPAGTAKTSLAQAWAFTHDLPVVIVEGQSIQTASDWFGGLVPNHTPGATAPFVWEWSDAAKLILTGQPCLVVLDELNRPENERALNGIMGLTDWKATVKHPGMPHAVTLKPGQCVVATLNEGPEYVGTVEVDAAVRNRFSTGIRMDYATEAVEVRILLKFAPGLEKEVAQRLVRVAATQRAKRDDDTLYPSHNVISPRALVDVAQNITVGGLTAKEALWANLDSVFWPEDRPALTTIIEAQFGPDPVDIDDTLADDDDVDQMMTAQGF